MNSGNDINTVLVNTSEDAPPQRNVIAVSVAEFSPEMDQLGHLCLFIALHKLQRPILLQAATVNEAEELVFAFTWAAATQR